MRGVPEDIQENIFWNLVSFCYDLTFASVIDVSRKLIDILGTSVSDSIISLAKSPPSSCLEAPLRQI